MARGAMTMRADWQPRLPPLVDEWNRPTAPTWGAIQSVPCRVWVEEAQMGAVAVRTVGAEVERERIRGMFPLSTPIQPGDRVAAVRDRLGQVLFAGPLAVETVSRRPRYRAVTFAAQGK